MNTPLKIFSKLYSMPKKSQSLLSDFPPPRKLFFYKNFFLKENSNFANAEEPNTADISREAARQAAENPNEKPVERVEIDERELEQPDDENILQESFVLKGTIPILRKLNSPTFNLSSILIWTKKLLSTS